MQNAKQQPKQRAKTSVVTGECRAGYVNVFQPRLNELSGNEEFSMTLFVPKSDKATIAKLEAAVDAAIAAKWPNETPRKLRMPLRDGDDPDEDKSGEPWTGHYFINVKSRNRPGIVDAFRNPVIDANAFLSGDFCRADLNAFGYQQKGNVGVSFGLNNVQVTRKGDPLTSRRRAEDAFDDWDNDGGTRQADTRGRGRARNDDWNDRDGDDVPF